MPQRNSTPPALTPTPTPPPRPKGYVVDADGTKRLWVARRSRDKQTWPGKLDHIVAGGQVGDAAGWFVTRWGGCEGRHGRVSHD